MNRHLCELNSRTKEARPEDYVQDADRVYLTRPIERGKELTLVLLAINLTQSAAILSQLRKQNGKQNLMQLSCTLCTRPKVISL